MQRTSNWRVYKSGKFIVNGLAVAGVMAASVMASSAAQALPTGGSFTVNTGTIATNGTNTVMNINHTGDAIIEWNDFSISAGDVVNINNGIDATLNRVVTNTPSQIYGQLNSSGDVYLINENGILVGSTGEVNVGGTFVASTLDLSDGDFLNGGDNQYAASNPSKQKNVTVQGTINSAIGDVQLFSNRKVTARNANITAAEGEVLMANGKEILVKEVGAERVSIIGTSNDVRDITIQNSSIEAGGIEVVSGKSMTNPYAMAINVNNSRLKAEALPATSIVTSSDGSIRLEAVGSGRIQLTRADMDSVNNNATTSEVLIKTADDGSNSADNGVHFKGRNDIKTDNGKIGIDAPLVAFSNESKTTLNVEGDISINATDYLDTGGEEWAKSNNYNAGAFTLSRHGRLNVDGDLNVNLTNGDFVLGKVKVDGDVSINSTANAAVNANSVLMSNLNGGIGGIYANNIFMNVTGEVRSAYSPEHLKISTELFDINSSGNSSQIKLRVIDSAYSSNIIEAKATHTSGNVLIENDTLSSLKFTNGSSFVNSSAAIGGYGQFIVNSQGDILIDDKISADYRISLQSYQGSITSLNNAGTDLHSGGVINMVANNSIKGLGVNDHLNVETELLYAFSNNVGDINIDATMDNSLGPNLSGIFTAINAQGNINADISAVVSGAVDLQLEAHGGSIDADLNNVFTYRLINGFADGNIHLSNGGFAVLLQGLNSTNGNIRIEDVLYNIRSNGDITVNDDPTNGKDVYLHSLSGAIMTGFGKTITGKNVTLSSAYGISSINSMGTLANDFMNVAYTGSLILANSQGSGLPTGTVKIHHVNQGQYITY